MSAPKKKDAEFIRVGKNEKWFLLRKDNLTLSFADILTADGKAIKQEALKLMLHLKAFKKAHDRLRELVLKAVDMEIPSNGDLTATYTVGAEPNLFDKEKAIAFILANGGNPADFYRKGEPKKTLYIK